MRDISVYISGFILGAQIALDNRWIAAALIAVALFNICFLLPKR